MKEEKDKKRKLTKVKGIKENEIFPGHSVLKGFRLVEMIIN